ncbi:MAG: hypothetical protein IJS99_05965 [Synergistaceae bacterium]|nr:hypothetical protein [Synergistaceae bacterium]
MYTDSSIRRKIFIDSNMPSRTAGKIYILEYTVTSSKNFLFKQANNQTKIYFPQKCYIIYITNL